MNYLEETEKGKKVIHIYDTSDKKTVDMMRWIAIVNSNDVIASDLVTLRNDKSTDENNLNIYTQLLSPVSEEALINEVSKKNIDKIRLKGHLVRRIPISICYDLKLAQMNIELNEDCAVSRKVIERLLQLN